MKRVFMVAVLLMLATGAAYADTINVFDTTISANDTVSWTNDNVYVLNERIFAEEGSVLTIEAGTVIQGKPSVDPENATCLIISRGAKIYAIGTAAEPIIFTAEGDDVNNPSDILYNAQGLWGGLILLGRAVNNEPDTGEGYGTGLIEGIPDDGTGRALFGGNDDTDSSGELRYVSIRHAGTELAAGKEINGLSMGCVGSGTVIDYVEVYANFDDGFEWWGGTVECKHLISAFCGDDMFDYDQGFRGKGQFWFGIYKEDDGNNGGEHDGGDTVESAEPYSIPTIYNVTYIGSGATASGDENDQVLKIRENAGGKYINSIFTDFTEKGISIEDNDGDETTDSRARLEAGDLVIKNNIFWHIGSETDSWDVIGSGQTHTVAYLSDAAQANTIADPGISVSRTPGSRQLDPKPTADGVAYQNLAPYPLADSFFDHVNFKGAVGSNDWMKGWTAIDLYGFLADKPVGIESVASDEPVPFDLGQNFPNPFNPATTINFNLTVQSHVRLAVYDALGRMVDTLVDNDMIPGSYSVTWNADNHAAGVYFCRLEAGNTVMTRKMTYVK